MNLGPAIRFDDGRMLSEQLKLLLSNVGASLVPTIVLSVILVWSLRAEGNAVALPVWAACVIGSKVLNALHAHRTLRNGIDLEGARHLAWTLTALNAVDGLTWGALPWVTLDEASVAGKVLVFAVMAGVTSNAMSVLSPVLPVFLAFCVCAVTAMSLKLSLMPDPEFQILAFITLLYVATHVVQGGVAAMAAKSAINLRFENVELIGLLREETAKANAAHQAAELANLAKSRFLAAASHDLRQPIHALGLFLEVIGKEPLTDTQRRMLENSQTTTRASSEMLNTLLDFSRIEAGVVEPQLQNFHLQSILDKLDNELAPWAVEKGLVFRSRETQVTVQSDPILVELILRNLLSNAIRYTRTGGVLMGCRTRGNHVSVEVWDTGIGIEASQQREVFREFHQLGNPERDRNKGLGLGLAIAGGLAQVLNSELTLRSVPGRGSVFKFVLPVSGKASEAGHSETVPMLSRSLALKVLVIDDDAAVRTATQELLCSWGCTCWAVESIEEALDAAAVNRPDIVISDYRLRDQRNGAEAIQLLRQKIGEHLPALLVTGDTDPDRLREAQSSGVPLLHKPVPPEVLRQKLVAMVENDHG